MATSERCEKRERGSVWTLAAVVLAAGQLAGCGGAPERSAEEPPRNVRVLTLQPTTLEEHWEISGPVRPVRGTDVSAEEGGVVAALPHDKGSRVRGGDVLVELDRRLLGAELEAARAMLAQQEHTVDKTRQLFAAGKVSRQELLSVEAQHAQAEAQARITELRHERAAVKAPFAGVVADRYVELGQLVVAGMPVARVVDLYTLKLEGYLTEREVGWVKQGAPAEVTLDGAAGSLPARVHWVGSEASPKNGKFPVEIRVANERLSLPVGAVGRARVFKGAHPDALVLPRDAIVASGAGPAVFVVEGDTARAVAVELGPDQGSLVVITEGLRPGDRAVVRGQRELLSGVRVRVTGEATSRDGSAPGDPVPAASGAAAAGSAAVGAGAPARGGEPR